MKKKKLKNDVESSKRHQWNNNITYRQTMIQDVKMKTKRFKTKLSILAKIERVKAIDIEVVRISR